MAELEERPVGIEVPRNRLTERLKAKNAPLKETAAMKREIERLLSPIDAPAAGNGHAPAITVKPQSVLDRLVAAGFRLADVRDRAGIAVSVNAQGMQMTVAARKELGDPKFVNILTSADQIALVPAQSGDPTAFRADINGKIVCGYLIRRLFLEGWEKKRYKAENKGGALIFSKPEGDA
jgi:hypothetical protein